MAVVGETNAIEIGDPLGMLGINGDRDVRPIEGGAGDDTDVFAASRTSLHWRDR